MAIRDTGKDPSWYQRLVESTNAIPWEADLATFRFTYISPAIEALLGYPVEAWGEENFWLEHLHPEDREWAPSFCANACAQGQDHEFEYRMLAADGRVVWIRDVVTVTQGADGRDALQGFMFDISQRRQVEAAMRALAVSAPRAGTDDFFYECVRNLATVYGARYAFIGLLQESRADVTTLAVWAGEGFAANFAYNLEGTPCKDILDQSKEFIPSRAAELYAEDEMLVQMGVEAYFGAPLIDANGTTIGLVSVMDTKPMELSDWTAPVLGMFATRIAVELEKRLANQQLRELNQNLERRVAERTAELEALNIELEAFSYSVSHDLRAPLRVVDGFSQVLLDEYAAELDATAQDYLHRIHNGSQRMGQLIEDLLGLSRVTRHPLNRRRVDLSALAHDTAAQLRESHPEHNIQLIVDEDLLTQGDPELLRIALSNLLHNAWKYTGRNSEPRVEVRRQQDGKTPVFVVRDNGVGFDMRYADKLFTAFQRLHSEQDFPGHGIGLATVARVIHRHGGRVWAQAEPGQGAEFFFTLP